ncbi:MAG: serine/threonine-protein kinase, partial [Bythopirellula sp.]
MADDADAQQPPPDGPQPAGSPVADSPTADDDATVLTSQAVLSVEEFPQGLSPSELALTLKGQLLGHFHLQEFIGGGGMGAVFKALDTTLDRIVAVKVVASQHISTEDLQRRFLVEAQSTARLDHPNIARIHYVGRDRGLPFIVFEYIDGVNLRDVVLNHGPVPLGDALSYTTQIAHALAHAWQKEVVHRDIKPSNILITREGQAKLVDMGLARVHHLAATDDELTNSGVTLGTFDYISPEQARDPREADTRSDIYSLGCTLFYMLAGRPPFAEGTAVQKLLQHQDQLPPNLSQLRPEVPASVAKLVQTMLAKSPELRPQTPNELVSALHDVFQELGIQAPASPTPLPLIPQRVSASRWQTHLPWAIPLAALFIVALASSTIQWSGQKPVEFEPLRFPGAETMVEEKTDPSAAASDGEQLPVTSPVASAAARQAMSVPMNQGANPQVASEADSTDEVLTGGRSLL